MTMQRKSLAWLQGMCMGIFMAVSMNVNAAPTINEAVQKALQNAEITAVRIDPVPNSASARVAISTTRGEKHIIVTASHVKEVMLALSNPMLTGVKNSLTMNTLIQSQPQLQQALKSATDAQVNPMAAGTLQAKLQGQHSATTSHVNTTVPASKGAALASNTVSAMPGAAAMVTSTLLAANQQASK